MRLLQRLVVTGAICFIVSAHLMGGEIDVQFGKPCWTTVKVFRKILTNEDAVLLLDNGNSIHGNTGGSVVFCGWNANAKILPLAFRKAADKELTLRVHGAFYQESAAELATMPEKIRWDGMPNVRFTADRIHAVGEPDD